MLLHNLLNNKSLLQYEGCRDYLNKQLEDFFILNKKELSEVIKKAHLVKEKIDTIDTFIQKCTEITCPNCKDVCCINKHGQHDLNDLIFIYSLGLKPPNYKIRINDHEPCQFLSPQGCRVDRYLRPFRCIWYFCNALLESAETMPSKKYREFICLFHEIINIRREFIYEFSCLLERHIPSHP